MFINCNFQLLYNTLIDQNRHIKQNRTGNLLLSVLYYSLSIIAFGGAIAMAYLLLLFGCVLTDSCYYFNGGV
jgi:asparagine N-glycosylation enzyme membrane subunit Stt3